MVAIALIKDLDDGKYGNAYNFDVQVADTTTYPEDFEVRMTQNPYVYLVVHTGDRVSSCFHHQIYCSRFKINGHP